MKAYKKDYMVLLQFVAASFSNNYNLEYDKESDSVDLSILVEVKVEGEKRTIARKLHFLSFFQIIRLFEIYLEEMLNYESLCVQYDSEKKAIEEERKMKLLIYQKKIGQLKNKMGSNDILSDMDDLLNS